VVVDFQVDAAEADEIYIVISNIGGTMARNVRLKFHPELTSSLDSNPNITPPRELKPLREGVPSLPPGKRIPIMFDLFTQRDSELFPDVFLVEIRFEAPALGHELRDEAVLDLGLYRNVLHAIHHDIHDVHERLKELVAEVRKWAAVESRRRPSS
jgi:hypothetical protein